MFTQPTSSDHRMALSATWLVCASAQRGFGGDLRQNSELATSIYAKPEVGI